MSFNLLEQRVIKIDKRPSLPPLYLLSSLGMVDPENFSLYIKTDRLFVLIAFFFTQTICLGILVNTQNMTNKVLTHYENITSVSYFI